MNWSTLEIKDVNVSKLVKEEKTIPMSEITATILKSFDFQRTGH